MTFVSFSPFSLTLPQSPDSSGVFWDKEPDGRSHLYIHAPLVQGSRIMNIVSHVIEKELEEVKIDDFYVRRVRKKEIEKGRLLDLPPLIVRGTDAAREREYLIKFNPEYAIFHFRFSLPHEKKLGLESDLIGFLRKTCLVSDRYIALFNSGYPPLEKLTIELASDLKEFFSYLFPKIKLNYLHVYLGQIVSEWSRFERIAYLESSVSGVKRSRSDELKEKILEVEEYKKQQRAKMIAPLIKKHLELSYRDYPKGLEFTYEDFKAIFSKNPKQVEHRVLLKSRDNEKKSREITRLFLTFFKSTESQLKIKGIDLSCLIEEALSGLEERDKILYRAQILALIATVFDYEKEIDFFQKTDSTGKDGFEIARKIGFDSMKIAKIIYETDLAIKSCRDVLFERRKGLLEARIQARKGAKI